MTVFSISLQVKAMLTPGSTESSADAKQKTSLEAPASPSKRGRVGKGEQTLKMENPANGALHLQGLFGVAQRVGFEPTVPLLVHLISSQGRYNHFDTAAYSVFTAGAEERASDIC